MLGKGVKFEFENAAKCKLLEIRKSRRLERVVVLLCRLDRLLVLFRSPGQ